MFILVPVQVYIEKASLYGSLLDFYPHMFEGFYPEGNFSWHHLWFIAYLFVIALFISPFLGLLRSEKFAGFTRRLEGIVTKPLALNIFIIPLLLSQIVLRNYFEFGTNALVNDWASMTFYIIFFLSGFILLPNKNIAEAIRKQRVLYLAETIILTIIMFRVPGLFESERTGEIIWDVTALFLAWACGITAVGFAKQYLNFDSDFRKTCKRSNLPLLSPSSAGNCCSRILHYPLGYSGSAESTAHHVYKLRYSSRIVLAGDSQGKLSESDFRDEEGTQRRA